MPDADLSLLLDALKEAGELALAMQAKGFAHRKKADGTSITDVDHAVDDLLKARITVARPEDGWLSEETPDTSVRLGKSRLWIVDPIDGTRGFATGMGFWGIGMALTSAGAAQLSGLIRPADGKLIHAIAGGGAFLNGKRLSPPSGQSRQVIAPKSLWPAIEQAGFLPSRGEDLPLLLRLAAIASGEIAGALSLGEKNDWDIAAGHLLVTETGGKISTGDGGPVVYNQARPWQPGLVAASNAAIHAVLLKAVKGT